MLPMLKSHAQASRSWRVVVLSEIESGNAGLAPIYCKKQPAAAYGLALRSRFARRLDFEAADRECLTIGYKEKLLSSFASICRK